MKKDGVLDSYALLAYFQGEAAGRTVRDLLKEAAEREEDLWLSVVNWGEILYIIEREDGTEKRKEIAHLMNQMHLRIVDADQEITALAASYKAKGGISYADCFAAALAKLKNAELITGDKEFKVLSDHISIRWI